MINKSCDETTYRSAFGLQNTGDFVPSWIPQINLQKTLSPVSNDFGNHLSKLYSAEGSITDKQHFLLTFSHAGHSNEVELLWN